LTLICYIVLGLLGLALLGALLSWAYICHAGNADVVVLQDAPWELASRDDKSMVIKKKLDFVNRGKSCSVIVDAILHSELPYEQYDGIEVRCKAERDGYPREDDYFEAVIIEHHGKAPDHIEVWAIAKLTARKGMSLEEALAHMVDLPMDLVWQYSSRDPIFYRKERLVATAEEIAALAGVTLVRD